MTSDSSLSSLVEFHCTSYTYIYPGGIANLAQVCGWLEIYCYHRHCPPKQDSRDSMAHHWY